MNIVFYYSVKMCKFVETVNLLSECFTNLTTYEINYYIKQATCQSIKIRKW